jgi:hypothetical protein
MKSSLYHECILIKIYFKKWIQRPESKMTTYSPTPAGGRGPEAQPQSKPGSPSDDRLAFLTTG